MKNRMEKFVDLDINEKNSEEKTKIESVKLPDKRGNIKGKSRVWEFFRRLQDGRAECKKCGNIYKTCGNTSNMFNHIKRAHPSIENIPKSMLIINSLVSTRKYEKSSDRAKVINKALIKMIATDLQPFIIVEDSGFKDFVYCLDPKYTLPSRTTLRNTLLKDMYTNMCEKLKTHLDSIKYCSITTDGWTSRANDYYVTVTCHFVDEGYHLRSAVLSTNKLDRDTDHSSENIAETLRCVLSEWGIFEKVTTIVSDNASSMIKSCDLLKKRHLPCFAHTLNLIVQDTLKLPEIEDTMKKCKKIVTFFKSSSIAYAKLKLAQNVENPYSLIQETPTRWNSSFAMLNRMLLIEEHVSSVLLKTSKAPLPLTADQITILKDVVKLLEPFEKATNQVSGSSFVTISLVIPIGNDLHHRLNKLKDVIESPEGIITCTHLIESVNRRLFPYESRTPTRISTLIDPRFKKEGFRNSDAADLTVNLIQSDLTTFWNTSSNPKDSPTPNASENDEFFPFMKEKLSRKTYTPTVNAIIKVRQYLEKPHASKLSCPLEYWKILGEEFSEMRNCAMRYLCIPACSTESERMFSKAGNLISDKRAALKPKNVDMLLFLNKNQWIE